MIDLFIENNFLVLTALEGDLAPRHENQLAFWGFDSDPSTNRFCSTTNSMEDLAAKVTDYLNRCKLTFEISSGLEALLTQRGRGEKELNHALIRGHHFKDGNLPLAEFSEFLSFLNADVPRKLKDHQRKAALHLLAVQNAANFSVPGSGKTTVVLSVFHYLRKKDEVDALFVVGPPSCFGPWRAEYEAVLGTPPSCQILAGGDIEVRHGKYQVNRETVANLYLTSFQTLRRDWERVRGLFEHQSIRFFLVVDEAHYIKQVNGSWATATLAVSPHASRRCILTGTPFPRSYTDAFNLFDVLWPGSPPISEQRKHRIEYLTQQNDPDGAANVLDEAIAPLFYCVRKVDLGLAPQRFHEPVRMPMHHYEKLIYDTILDKIREVSQSDYFRDIDLVLKLRRGRIMRLRQTLSYAGLLGSAIRDYKEDLLQNNQSLAQVIRDYDTLETPAKLEALLNMVGDLCNKNQKIVIWSNFVRTLELIRAAVANLGFGVRMIYGGTPLQRSNVAEELSREGIIQEFVRSDSGVNILVANPAACAESISLHKSCSHAIYYDLSYNCAQYLQSLDRIHRVGGSEEKEAHYHFLQYEDSLDQDILTNLQGKAERMKEIINQDYPIYSLDMFTEDEELEAYERLFGHAR